MAETIYYNAKLFNNTDTPIQASLSDTRAAAILQCACDYRCSIIRFSVNGSLLPLVIPRIISTSPLVLTGYTVALSFLGSTYTQPVNFNAPTNNQIQYAYYSFGAFLLDINAAYRLAYLGLVGLQPALAVTCPNPPVLIWNETIQYFTIYFNSTYIPNVIISMNYDLYNLFESFQAVFNGYNLLNGRDYDLILTVENTILENTPVNRPPIVNSLVGPVASITQEWTSLSQFTPVQSIFFTSYQIPIKNENLPLRPGDQQNVNINSNSLPIITDFEPLLSDQEFNRGQLLYLPTAQYRYITLESNMSLNTIDLQCFWTDRAGTVYPFLIDLGYYISVKVLFEKIV